MRIAMMSSSYPLYPGEATAPFIEEIAAGLARRGHDVHLLVPWHPALRRGSLERGVHVHCFRYAPHPALNIWGYAQSLVADRQLRAATLTVAPFALAGTLHALHRLVQHKRTPLRNGSVPASGPFDLLHAHWLLPNAVPAALVARACGLPLVVSLHGNDVYMAERYWLTTPPAGLTLRAAAAVTACSRDLYRRALRLGAPAARSHVIPYGVDMQTFQADPCAAATVRRELGLSANQNGQDAPLVLGLGRLVYKKGFGVLLAAWPAVLARHPAARLVLVGYGDLRATLEQQARELGIAQCVHFTGQLERARTATYLAAGSVFVLPIVGGQGSDGLPNVLLEAMSAARPIVASRGAGVPDVLTDGECGLLVPENDPPALAAAICRLLDDPALAARLGAAAQQHIARQFTWEHTVQQFDEVYQRVCTYHENRPSLASRDS
jgi:glycosyltransferase involved in cell wall biosynthesis